MAAEEAEPLTAESTESDVLFAFVIAKDKQGDLQVKNVGGTDASLDDLYSAIMVWKRNIEAQHAAGMVQQAMMQAAMEAQGQRQSGIVTPPGVNL